MKPAGEDGLVETLLHPWPGTELDPSLASYFPNITGFIRGTSSPLNITPSALLSSGTSDDEPWYPFARDLMGSGEEREMGEMGERLGEWNWTRGERVTMSVSDEGVQGEGEGEGRTDVALVHVSWVGCLLGFVCWLWADA